MATTDHRRYEEDLAAYLLDALSTEDALQYEAHLHGCARCQGDERWLRAAVEVLPSSVEQLEPSPALRKRLLDEVNADAKAARADGRRAARRIRRRPFLRPAAALAAVAIVAAGVAGYLVRGGGGNETSTVAAKPLGPVPSARGELVRTGNTTDLRVSGLPVQRHGRVYQVWLASQNLKKFAPSSVFVVDRSGRGAVTIPEPLQGVQAVLVTSEPAGGSGQPTTKPVLQAPIQ